MLLFVYYYSPYYSPPKITLLRPVHFPRDLLEEFSPLIHFIGLFSSELFSALFSLNILFLSHFPRCSFSLISFSSWISPPLRMIWNVSVFAVFVLTVVLMFFHSKSDSNFEWPIFNPLHLLLHPSWHPKRENQFFIKFMVFEIPLLHHHCHLESQVQSDLLHFYQCKKAIILPLMKILSF